MGGPSVKTVLRVRLTPRGGRDAVIGFRASDGVLLLRVAAPPVGGAANRSCVDLLASAMCVRRGQVTMVSGDNAREKRFEIESVTDAERDAWLAKQPTVGT